MALMVLGIMGYVATGMASPTALIPAGFGVVLAGLGYYGRHEATRKTAMHLAMGVALLGLLGSARGLLSLPALLTGGEVARPAAVASQSAMAAIMIVYLAAGINSFRAARAARR
jgi:hypothetical protein